MMAPAVAGRHQTFADFVFCVVTEGHGRGGGRQRQSEVDPGHAERAGGESRDARQTEDQEHLCHQVHTMFKHTCCHSA